MSFINDYQLGHYIKVKGTWYVITQLLRTHNNEMVLTLTPSDPTEVEDEGEEK